MNNGQLGIFMQNGYWGHQRMKLPPEANLMAASSLPEAFRMAKEIVKFTLFWEVKIHPRFLGGWNEHCR